MANVFFFLGSGSILVAVLFVSTAAQSNSCNNALVSLAPCLTYITGNSTTPSSSCCQQLGTVIQSEPQCLCMVINGDGAGMGINVNQTRALALPGACNLRTPPLSQCNGKNLAADTNFRTHLTFVRIILHH